MDEHNITLDESRKIVGIYNRKHPERPLDVALCMQCRQPMIFAIRNVIPKTCGHIVCMKEAGQWEESSTD